MCECKWGNNLHLICDFLFSDISNVTSSSIHGNNVEKWGPQLVIDGILSHSDKNFFHSELEDYPWLQWRLPRRIKMSGITLKNRINCCGNHLRDVEIRAGMHSVERDFKGRITKNKVCGKFEGPGEYGGEYTINCDKEMLVDYITVQILDDNAILSINDIRIESARSGTF